ncbi:LysR family transcriptional regulator [Ewingella sp. AOP8-B2-18]
MMNSSGTDRIDLMRTFVRIVESGNLSAAALQLNTSQPTVSRRLQTLERMLGVTLILRSTHAMKLTDDGERCYEQAKQLLERWAALEDELRVGDAEPVGRLRVRAPHAFGQNQLIEPLTRYLQRYPHVTVDWILNDTRPDFIAEDVDCVIQVGHDNDPATIKVLLAEIPRIVVAAPSLLEKHPVSQLEELAQAPWVALSLFYRNEVVLRHGADGSMQHLNIRPRMATDSLNALRMSALSGLGVAMVSSWIVADDLACGELVHVLPEWEAVALPVYLVYPYSSYYPARLRTFIAMIREVVPKFAEIAIPSGER